MNKNLTPFLNPINWMRAYLYNRKNARFDKSSYDLELYLYSRILKNDMLHYGYFEDVQVAPETISLKQLEDAQVRYAENIINLITDREHAILDAGCGMGGLSALLLDKGFKPEALTPNLNQVEHIQHKYPQISCYPVKFEDFKTEKKYGTLIHSESLQYIRLQEAFEKAEKILIPGGKWIIVDYFRTGASSISKSGHLLSDFQSMLDKGHWKILEQKDITLHVLPTISFVNMYAERFLKPLKHFAFEKLRFKKGWLYYLTGNLRECVSQKLSKELAAVDPGIFIKEKKYMLYVLQKQ